MSEPAFATAFAAGFPAASAAIALPDDRIDAETTARMNLRNTADRFIRPLLLLNGASRIPRDAIRNVLLRRPPGCAQYTAYNIQSEVRRRFPSVSAESPVHRVLPKTPGGTP